MNKLVSVQVLNFVQLNTVFSTCKKGVGTSQMKGHIPSRHLRSASYDGRKNRSENGNWWESNMNRNNRDVQSHCKMDGLVHIFQHIRPYNKFRMAARSGGFLFPFQLCWLINVHFLRRTSRSNGCLVELIENGFVRTNPSIHFFKGNLLSARAKKA